MKNQRLNACQRVIASTAITAGIVSILEAGLNWLWVRHQYDPSWMEESLPGYYKRCLAVTFLFVGSQMGVLFVASIILAVLRRRHSMKAMLFSGLLLVVLDAVSPKLGFLPDSTIRLWVYMVGFPLLVLGLQWWPEQRERSAPNNPVETIATDAANSQQ